jgi:hypothetical protein
MDLATAMSELPEAHAAVLRMHQAGTSEAEMVKALGIEPEALAPLLRVAQAKLASLLAAPDPQGNHGSPGQGQDPKPRRGPDP